MEKFSIYYFLILKFINLFLLNKHLLEMSKSLFYYDKNLFEQLFYVQN